MMALTTLIADTRPLPSITKTPGRYRIRQCERRDVGELGRAYFAAYPASVAGSTEEEAVRDIDATFDGDYGQLYASASEVVATPAARIVAAVLTVERPTWDDVPDGPFIVELFTARLHRRRGLGRLLLRRCLHHAFRDGHATVALRVDAANTVALGLYEGEGFKPLDPT